MTTSVCPGCMRPIEAGGVPCARCGTAYHAACRDPLGCVVAGCGQPHDRPGARPGVVQPPLSRAWWAVRASGAVSLLGLAIGVVFERDLGPSRELAFLVSAGALAAMPAFSWIACVLDLAGPGARGRTWGTAGLLFLITGLGCFFGGQYFGAGGELSTLLLLYASVGAALTGLGGTFSDTLRLRAMIAVVGGLVCAAGAGLAVPMYRADAARHYTRACYANQKTIAGAVEMYNLDRNTRRTALDGSFFEALKSGGYLQDTPRDPGPRPGDASNYREIDGGNGVRCVVHGSIQ